MRIAIVDDDPIVCQSLETILTATGTAEVLWMANDGDAAVRRYFETPASRPDVLLIDIQMPGTSGLDAAREILATDPAARILFLTTFADQSYIAQAMGLGAKGYLIKQDVAAVGPALQAVMAGQVVLGAEVLGKLTERTPDPADSEERLHEQAAEAFARAGLEAAHEVRLAPRCRIDFMVGGVGVEIKKKRPQRAPLIAQLTRYASCPQVERLVVLAPRGVDLPKSIGGKPVTMMSLERLWGIMLP